MSSTLYNDYDTGGEDSYLQPLYSGLASGNTIRHYQQQNNREEVAESLPWGERLRAGYTGFAHGLSTYGPEQIYRSLRTLGKIVGSDDLQTFATDGIDRELRIREIDPYYQVPESWHKDGWGRSLYEGSRGIASSAYGMLPGAAISLLPGGQVIGLATLGGGAGGIAGLAEYDSFMDEAYEKFHGINPNITRQEIEDAHFWDAFWSGVAEGGTEAVTDILGGKLIGLVGKAGVKPAKHILDQLVRNVTKTVALEAGSEVATSMVQDYIREQAGLDYVGRVEAMKQTLGPALVGGALFGIGGTGLKLAQGKLRVDADSTAAKTRAKTEAEYRADFEAKTKELRQQFREAHYSPQSVSVFDMLTGNGDDHVKASIMMESVDSIAKSWAERTGLDVGEWRGDTAKLVDMFNRLDEHKANPGVFPVESLSSINDVVFSELSVEQKQSLADVYGRVDSVDANTGKATVIDPDAFGNDLRQVLTDPMVLEQIPEPARPAVESVRDGVLDLHRVINRNGLAGGVDPEVTGLVGKAVAYRDTNKPKPAAFIYEAANLDTIRKQYGDFSSLSAEQQTTMIKDMSREMRLNFDEWDLPVDQKGMLGFVDSEMKPILDKLMNRGKRKDAKQEQLAKTELTAKGIDLERFAEFTAQLTGNGDIKESAAVKARELMLTERIMLEKATELASIANETLAPADIMKWQMAGELHQQIHSMLRAVRSEGGHLLRAFNYIKKDPQLSQYRMNQLYDATGGLEAARYKLTAFANADSDSARADVLADSARAKSVNMFLEYRTLNMLSSVKTHLVNTVGNAGLTAGEIMNRFTAETMGLGQGVARGETLALIDGMWDGLRKVKEQWSMHKADKGGTIAALRSLPDMWDADPSVSIVGDAGMNQRSLTRENALDVIGAAKERIGLSKEHGMISNGLSYMVEYMGRMLGISSDVLLTTDMFFKTVAAHGELNALNHRKAMEVSGGDKAKYNTLFEHYKNNTPKEHRIAALEFGKFMTFQNDLTGFSKSLNDLRIKHPMTRSLIPFFKTPVNIMKYAARHTPGLANMFADINAELNSPDIAKRHIAEARVMTGTLLWTTALGLAASGYLTGSGPTDDNEREKARATGWQSNSLRLPGSDGEPDTYIALDRLDPAAFLLNTAASLVEIYDSMDNDDLGKAMWSGFAAAFRVASERSYLKSVADAVDAVTDWEGFKGDRARQGLFTSLVPASSMMRNITQQADPVQREISGIFDSIRAGIPGMSHDLPQRRNFLGEAVTSDGYFGSDFLSPLRQSMDKQDPVYDEIYRLTRSGQKIPSMPDKHIRHNGRAVKMDGKQYSQYLELAGTGLRFGGRNAKERIAETIQSQAYQQWDDEKKAKQIRTIIETYRAEAKKKMRMEDPSVRYLLGL